MKEGNVKMDTLSAIKLLLENNNLYSQRYK